MSTRWGNTLSMNAPATSSTNESVATYPSRMRTQNRDRFSHPRDEPATTPNPTNPSPIVTSHINNSTLTSTRNYRKRITATSDPEVVIGLRLIQRHPFDS